MLALQLCEKKGYTSLCWKIRGDEMTSDEIDRMISGRAIDELIHTKIICNDGFFHPFGNYSTEMAAAWRVIDTVIAYGYNLSLNYEDEIWQAAFWLDQATWFAESELCALAICKAALQTKANPPKEFA